LNTSNRKYRVRWPILTEVRNEYEVSERFDRSSRRGCFCVVCQTYLVAPSAKSMNRHIRKPQYGSRRLAAKNHFVAGLGEVSSHEADLFCVFRPILATRLLLRGMSDLLGCTECKEHEQSRTDILVVSPPRITSLQGSAR
jgi:hypothetical protein